MDALPAALGSNGTAQPLSPTNGNAQGSLREEHLTDGAEYGAGGAGYFKPLWPGSNLDRREFVRLALQAFNEIGYT